MSTVYNRIVAILCAIVLVLGFAALAQAQDGVMQQGPITASSADCSVVNSCVTLLGLGASVNSVTVQISNAFIEYLAFEATVDGNVWFPVFGRTPQYGASAVTSMVSFGAATAGTWRVNATGLSAFRVRCATFFSGGASVMLQASAGVP